MRIEIIVISVLFIILMSIQLTLNSILVELKEIKEIIKKEISRINIARKEKKNDSKQEAKSTI